MSLVILANGEMPKNLLVINLLRNASFLICTDGSYKFTVDLGIKADVVIGDFDSIDKNTIKKEVKIIDAIDQNKSDLEKAINYCIDRSYKKIILIGSTGLKEDHSFANLFLLEEFSKKISINIYTDYYKLFINLGNNKYESTPGLRISLISFYKNNIVSTEGLKYELRNKSLQSASHGLSNVCKQSEFIISSSEPIFIFQEHSL